MRRDELVTIREQNLERVARMRQLISGAETAGRDLTVTKRQEFDRLEHEARTTRVVLEQHQHLFRPELELSTTVDDGGWNAYRREHRVSTTAEGPEYRNAFWAWASARDDREIDPSEYRVLSKASGAAGAYAVPTGFYDRVIAVERFKRSIASLATEVRTDSGETIEVPLVSAHGTAAWTAENASYVPSDETFAQGSRGAFKAAAKVIVFEELIADSGFDLAAYLANELGEQSAPSPKPPTPSATALGSRSGSPMPRAVSASCRRQPGTRPRSRTTRCWRRSSRFPPSTVRAPRSSSRTVPRSPCTRSRTARTGRCGR
jgi:HK97 family phage major capsid protein